MLNVKKMLAKILTPVTATEVEMPFTPPCNGILLVRLRTNAQGRSYETFTNANPANVEGYNVLDGYFSGIVCVTKNNEVTVSARSNVHTGQQKYIFIPTKIGGGGYFLKVFSIISRLAERWWEYAERKETLHETFADGNLHITHGFKIRDNGWKCCNELGKRIYSAVKRTLADCFRRNSDNNRKRFCKRTQQINRGWFRAFCTDKCGKRLPRLRICGGNERKREIGYVPKHRLNTDYSVRTELYQAEIAISERGWSCA